MEDLLDRSGSRRLVRRSGGGRVQWGMMQPEGRTMKYKIVLKQSEEGYSVSCPGLPGCWSQGETEEDAIANIQDAIREYLAARDEMIEDSDIREVEVAL